VLYYKLDAGVQVSKLPYYVLDAEHNPVEATLLEWADFFASDRRFLADEKIGEVRVATIFLGHDFSFGMDGMFECHVFGGPMDGEEEHYTTWSAAMAGHATLVERVKSCPTD
jgi:hypothetical protein